VTKRWDSNLLHSSVTDINRFTTKDLLYTTTEESGSLGFAAPRVEATKLPAQALVHAVRVHRRGPNDRRCWQTYLVSTAGSDSWSAFASIIKPADAAVHGKWITAIPRRGRTSNK